ncbi:MAG: NifB/NifX family molybdenum-iron cluster-binding protein [Candidatus Geothermincolia bacterium]
MLLAVSCAGPQLTDPVDPRFGRCAYLVIVDTAADVPVAVIENPFRDAGGGAGTRTAQMAVDRGVKGVLTGNIGPKAWDVLAAAGIEVYTGLSGRATDAVASFKAGGLEQARFAGVAEKAGLQQPSPKAMGPAGGGGGVAGPGLGSPRGGRGRHGGRPGN